MSAHSPKTVVFDLGKVVVGFDYAIAAGKIAARGKMTAAELAHFITHSPVFLQYETGLVTTEEFFHTIASATGFAGSREEFGGFFADIFWEIKPMVQWQALLCRRRIPTYAFSNTNELAIDHIRRSFPFFSQFTAHILSYEHKAMKPDPKLYEVVERLSGCQGADILYLDDRPENIETGLRRGWQAILHESPEKSLAAARALGLPAVEPEPTLQPAK